MAIGGPFQRLGPLKKEPLLKTNGEVHQRLPPLDGIFAVSTLKPSPYVEAALGDKVGKLVRHRGLTTCGVCINQQKQMDRPACGWGTP